MSLPDRAALGGEADRLLLELASFSEPGPGVTRLYLTPEHKAALRWLEDRMREVGLRTSVDAAATLSGRLEGAEAGAPALLLGSHIDSVREGGRYDGCMGVVLPLLALRMLREEGWRPPFAVELLAFGDEEGVRFPVTLTGSRALAGGLPEGVLDARDEAGVTLGAALRAFGCDPAALPRLRAEPASVLGYVECHIEQGPVLERVGRPLGIVTGIAAAARLTVTFAGASGHAGTVPMEGRRDALAAAAEAVLAVERLARGHAPAVGTVGRIEALPGAGNVIPGAARLTLDLRAPEDAALERLVREVEGAVRAIGAARGITAEIQQTHRAAGCAMDRGLSEALAGAAGSVGPAPPHLPSGAGHDAMALAPRFKAAMLFVRCKGGLSHHPGEQASPEDMGLAVLALAAFLRRWALAGA